MFVNINRVRFPKINKKMYIDKMSLTMICKGTDERESKNYWLNTISPGSTVLAYCDMKYLNNEKIYTNSIKVALAIGHTIWAYNVLLE